MEAVQKDAGLKQREAEALVHMNYGRAYASALKQQAGMDKPLDRKHAAAAVVAEISAAANRDPSTINRLDASDGRSTMEVVYGERAANMSAILSGKAVNYDLPKGLAGTKDFSALISKAQIHVNVANAEAYATRGVFNAVGPNGKYMEAADSKVVEAKEKLVNHMLHVKSAIDAAVDRQAFDRKHGDNLYNHFKEAAFDLGQRKTLNAEYSNFEKANTASLRQEVDKQVDARYSIKNKSLDTAKETGLNPANVARANAFKTMEPGEAVKQYPELAGAYAAQAIVDKRNVADGLSKEARMKVNDTVRNNLIKSIEQGNIPKIEKRDASQERQAATVKEAELSR